MDGRAVSEVRRDRGGNITAIRGIWGWITAGQAIHEIEAHTFSYCVPTATGFAPIDIVLGSAGKGLSTAWDGVVRTYLVEQPYC